MKKKPKYLACYKRWMKTGLIPDAGLCNVFGTVKEHPDKWEFLKHPLFDLFKPDQPFRFNQSDARTYWGYGKSIKNEAGYLNNYVREFSELRQTIVLLMAAMNNEL
jgi:hypothetical protein